MRRSWLIIIATGTLAFGGMLATAGPSAASPAFGHPQTRNFTPGGLAREMTGRPSGGDFTQVVRSTNRSGYVAVGSNGEAPCCTYSGGSLPLTNFGTVNFNSALVNGAGLCTTNPVEMVMVNQYGRQQQTSTSPISNCENFSVSYIGGSIWGL